MDNRLNVVLCWHMHQPQYRDLNTGAYRLPWTYLHAVKDYADMAAHLERYPDARAIVNFVPMLLEDILNYQVQVEGFLTDQRNPDDPLLAALASGSTGLTAEGRTALGKSCVRANEQRMIARFEPYRDLVELLGFHRERGPALKYLGPAFFDDLLVWYHLAWLGEHTRREDLRVQRLMKKARGYTREDRMTLLEVLSDVLGGLIPRYRSLSNQGRVELSMTPYAHPMLPLLIDFESAREAAPEMALPPVRYPGGEQRARWHIETGIEVFESILGERPTGCWPAEGGISDAAAGLLDEYGFRWIASGQGVLRNSLRKCHADVDDPAWPYRCYRLGASSMRAFFRDDALSDAIGFSYSDWHGEDAVANLVGRIEGVADLTSTPHQHVLSIIMDGENAWEHYPDNGYYLLDHLYDELSSHPAVNLTTYRDLIDADVVPAASLPSLCAGSWVYGTFSTWIGDADKNRAWHILAQAKRTYDQVLPDSGFGADEISRLERQLAVCEGSDWFWWFGDYNPVESLEDFSALFRLHVRNLHAMLGRPEPEGLDAPFGRGGAAEAGGTMRRGSA